jgi:hypothetical protein
VRIFKSTREELAGSWGKLQNEVLHNLVLLTKYYQGDSKKEVEESGACRAHEADGKSTYNFSRETKQVGSCGSASDWRFPVQISVGTPTVLKFSVGFLSSAGKQRDCTLN